MTVLPKIACLFFLLHNVPSSIGLVEGARGVNWNLGGDILNGLEHPEKLIGELGGDIKKGVEGFAEKAEHIGNDLFNGAEKIGSEIIGDVEKGAGKIVNGIEHGAEAVGSGVIGNIAKGAGELVEDVGKGAAGLIGDIGEGAEQIVEDIGGGIEKGAEGIIGGAKGAIEGLGGIVGKLTPKKKKNHHGGDSHEKHHNKHHKEDSREKHHGGHDKHHKKHEKEDSRERHDSHERRGGKHHYHKHTGRGIDRRTGIGSRDGIKTPILNLLGMTKTICKISFAAENVIADLGEFHIWADKQMGMIEHAAVNYVVDNFILKAVDGIRRNQNRFVDFIIDAHISIQTFVTNTIIEGYRVTKAPIRELFACY